MLDQSSHIYISRVVYSNLLASLKCTLSYNQRPRIAMKRCLAPSSTHLSCPSFWYHVG